MTTNNVTTAPSATPDPALLTGPDDKDIDPFSGKERSSRRKRIVLAVLLVLVMLLAALAGWYLLKREPIRMPGTGKDALPTYSFSMYGSNKPMGVAVSPSGGRIYVTSSEGTTVVQVYDRKGTKVGTLVPPKSTGPSHIPFYVAVDPISSDVYVSDRRTQSVYVYDDKGAYRRAFAPKGDLGGGWQPLGLAFDKAGSLYVTDVSGKQHRVLVFDRDSKLTRTIGIEAKLVFPNGIAIDSHGNVHVSDSNNGQLLVFSPAGKVIATINRGDGKGDLGLPRGAAIDTDDRLYVVDTTAQAVKVYSSATDTTPKPEYIGTFGGEGRLDGTFEYPNGVATDSRSRIYVTDRENNRVQVWSY